MDWRDNFSSARSRVNRFIPFEYYLLSDVRVEGAIVGYLGGAPIWEMVVDGGGTRYKFAGIAPRDCEGRLNVNLLNPGEWIVEPGLIYVTRVSQRR